MKKIFVVVLLFNLLFGYSQTGISDYQSLRDELRVINQNGQLEGNKENIDGSPYLFEEFVPGIIIQEDGNDLNAFFKYNALQDVVEIKINPNHSEIFILPRNEKFVFETKEFSLFIEKLITNEGEVIAGYKLKYFESDNLLFVGKSSSKITAAKKADTSYEKDTPSKIINNINYYISFNGEPLIPIKIKERYFRDLLGNSAKMQTYFKENKVKDIEDVKDLLRYYEGLSS